MDLDTITHQLYYNTKGYMWNLFKSSYRDLNTPAGKEIKTLEIGCGLGKFSVLLGLWGCRTTLIDSNVSALQKAKRLFDHFGLKCECIKADALALPLEFYGLFDVAVSFGLAEHFNGQERIGIIKSHINALRPGGLCFLQVPNALSPCYRFAFGARKALRLWPTHILEKPFTAVELKRIARSCGLRRIRTMSAQSIRSDFDYWIIENFKSLLKKLKLYKADKRMTKRVSPAQIAELVRFEYTHNLSFLSRAFTYPLVLIGEKESNSH